MAEIFAIGELLWDVFPDAVRLGGAPANVAFHLSQAGHEAHLISCVGNDELGRQAVSQLRESGLDTSFIMGDPERATGSVHVTLDVKGIPSFEIVRDVAWDYIPWLAELEPALSRAQAVVFGTLVQREEISRATLHKALLAAAGALKVLDLNFRPPFIDPEVVRESLEKADILKLNGDEMESLPSLLDMDAGPDFPNELRRRYGLERIYVTLGEKGCELISDEGGFHVSSPEVVVADTVGAGDAFTAALVDGELRHLPGAEIAAKACAVGAHVASQSGAMSPWPEDLRSYVKS